MSGGVVSDPVIVRVTFDCLTADEVIAGVKERIRRRGAFLEIGQEVPVGSAIRFEFLLGDGTAIASGTGEVKAFIESHMAVCVEFTGFDDDGSKAFIERFLPGLPWERRSGGSLN